MRVIIVSTSLQENQVMNFKGEKGKRTGLIECNNLTQGLVGNRINAGFVTRSLQVLFLSSHFATPFSKVDKLATLIMAIQAAATVVFRTAFKPK